MNQNEQHPQHSNVTSDDNDKYMNGAAVIDETGKETPITEEMIQAALNDILKACQPEK